MQTSVITGITGQTGSYLAELLLQKGHKVYGLKRRSSSLNTARIDHLYRDLHENDQLELVYGDLSDYSSIVNLVADTKPDYFYHCGAQSHVAVSFMVAENTFDITGTGVIRSLEAIRKHSPKTHFLMMASSEMFGSTPPPQNELTPFHPRSPYAVAKVAGYYATINYREAYKLCASNAIVFNHESPRRSETFVTRKITRAATRIKLGLQKKLYLGNLQAKRDWQHAKDVANAIITITDADIPNDYVLATGEMHSVQEFVELVFGKLRLDWQEYVKIDPKYFRPTEVDALCGSNDKFRQAFPAWQPQYTFQNLVEEMITEDMKLAQQELKIKSI